MPKKKNDKRAEIHPWRPCPAGEHWVATHSLQIPPSGRHPAGTVTTRHAHCALNPSKKDQLYPAEIHEIAVRHFLKLEKMPCPLALKFGKEGNAYDDLIAGWVQYPNLFKALVASESRFKPDILADKKNQNSSVPRS